MRGKTKEQAEAERKYKDELKARLASLLQNLKVPQSVLVGDVYKVRAWKESVAEAKATAKREKATAVSLLDAINGLERYR